MSIGEIQLNTFLENNPGDLIGGIRHICGYANSTYQGPTKQLFIDAKIRQFVSYILDTYGTFDIPVMKMPYYVAIEKACRNDGSIRVFACPTANPFLPDDDPDICVEKFHLSRN